MTRDFCRIPFADAAALGPRAIQISPRILNPKKEKEEEYHGIRKITGM